MESEFLAWEKCPKFQGAGRGPRKVHVQRPHPTVLWHAHKITLLRTSNLMPNQVPCSSVQLSLKPKPGLPDAKANSWV